MGRRAEALDNLVKELGTEDRRRSTDKMSAYTAGQLYHYITGEKPRWEKGKGWHLRKTLDAAEIETTKNLYCNDPQLPLTELEKLSQQLSQA